MKAFLLTIILLCYAQSENYSGKVVAVIDGDTIEVLRDGKAKRIRLSAIDCPEKGQAFGKEAKQFTSDMIFGKNVMVKPQGIDKYGRTIANIYLQDSIWVNKSLVDVGLAWHYKRYSSDKVLSKAEEKAQEDSIGLWKDKAPIAPWKFRQRELN